MAAGALAPAGAPLAHFGTLPAAEDAATRLNLDVEARRAAEAAALAQPDQLRGDQAKALLESCEAELGRKPEPRRIARLSYEMARLLEGPLADPPAALKRYLEAYRAAPEHLPSLRGARRALLASGDAKAALPLFDEELKLTREVAQKAALLYEKASVLNTALAKPNEARQALVAALDFDASSPTLLRALERAQREAKAWSELDAAYQLEANAVSSDARYRAAVIVERAQLAALERGPEEAIELYETALGLDPSAPGVLAALTTLLEARGRWRDLVQVLDRVAQLATDRSVRALAHYRAGRVQADRLGNVDEAISAIERASVETPDDLLLLEELARLYEAGKRWMPLVGVLERLAERTEEQSQKVGLLHRAGQICEERLGDAEAATEWYRRALEVDPGYLPVLQALGKLYTESEQWTALVAMHLGEAGATRDDVRRAAAHTRVAEILERRLGKGEQAVEHHARALGLVPGYAPAFKALTRLYQQAGRSRELIELYERGVDWARDGETKITYLFKIGRLYEDTLEAPQAAVVAYRRVLDVDAAHLGAIHAMQRAAERAADWLTLVQCLELEASKLQRTEDKVGLLHRAGEVLQDHLGDRDGALERFRKALALDRAHVPALGSLGRLYHELGRWQDLLETYELELPALKQSKGEQAALLFKMGELCEERLGDQQRAIGCHERALKVDASHTPSLRALVRIHTERQSWKDVVRLLELELVALREPELIARTALRLGGVYENCLDQLDAALEAHGRALTAVPEFRPSLDARVRLHEKKAAFAKVAEALSLAAAHATDTFSVAALQHRLAEVQRDRLKQPRDALGALQAVLATAPEDLTALRAAERLEEQLGEWDALIATAGTEARVAQNGLARAAALRLVAETRERHAIGSVEDVARAYLAILSTSPTDLGALVALERMALREADWALLAHVDAKLAALPMDPLLVAAYETRLAESLEAARNSTAIDMYRSALARDPDNLAAARGFSRVAERLDDPALLAEAAGHEARVLRDAPRGAALLVRSARVRVDKRADRAGAVVDLERALDISPEHGAARDQLRELLLAEGKVERLLDALTRAANAAKTPDARAALWTAVGTLLANDMKDLGAGLTALGRAIAERPGDAAALVQLADLHARASQWSEAVRRLREATASRPSPELLAAALFRLAWVLGKQLGDVPGARRALDELLQSRPDDRPALELLLELQTEQGDAAAAETAARLVNAASDPRQQAEAHGRVGRMAHQRGDLQAAVTSYQQALAIVGLSGEVAMDFESLLAQQRQAGQQPSWAAYAQGLAQYVDATPVAQVPLAAFSKLARVLDEELGRSADAITLLHRALGREPSNVGLRSELAQSLARAGRHQEALRELDQVLSLDPVNVAAWTGLVSSLRALRREERVALALAPLVSLGGGTDLDRVAVQGRVPKPAAARPSSFDTVALGLVDACRPEDQPGNLLVASLVATVGKLYPLDPALYGLTARDRLTARSGHPTRALADRIAKVFGAPEFELYVHQAHQGGVDVELGEAPALMVPAYVTTLPEAQQVFLLARALVDVARGLAPLHKLDAKALDVLLTATTRLVEPAYGRGVADEELLETLSKRISKALPWLGRKPVEDAARAFATAARPPSDEWLHRVRCTATRAACTLSDDLAGAITMVRRIDGDLARVQGPPLERGMALLGDMMRFAVGDAAQELRQHLGMA